MADFFHPLELNHPQKDSWRLFKILSEFVMGFDTFGTMGPCISIFGSTRLPRHHPYYTQTKDISFKIASKGFSIITGAGPGLMEAANKGAQEAKASSAGLMIDRPTADEEPNKYIDAKLALRFRYFFVRKVMFVRYAQGFVFMPGGLGTLDELFEIITLIQTKKITPVPVFLVGTKFWTGLLGWIKEMLLEEKCISKHDLDIITLSDDLDEVAEKLLLSYQERVKNHEAEEAT